MKINPLERDIRKLKLGDEFYIKARFVSATKNHVAILIGNDYGLPITLRAEMGELAYLYEEAQEDCEQLNRKEEGND